MFKLIAKIFYLATLAVETLVAIRFVAKLIKASEANSLVSWVYSQSEMFIQPFSGITSDTLVVAGLEIELTTVVALIFYMIIAFVLTELIKTFSHE
jgi:hypothetical protein